MPQMASTSENSRDDLTELTEAELAARDSVSGAVEGVTVESETEYSLTDWAAAAASVVTGPTAGGLSLAARDSGTDDLDGGELTTDASAERLIEARRELS